MRDFSVVVAVVFLTAAVRVNASGAEPPTTTAAGELTYVVECRMLAKTADGKEEALLAPWVTVSEGRMANIKDLTQTPFVTAAKLQGATEAPQIVVLEEGLDIELTVHRDRDGFATLDATIHDSKITDVKMKRDRQSPRHETRTVRVAECLELGDELTVELDGPGRTKAVQFAVYLPGMARHWQKSKTPEAEKFLDLRPLAPQSERSSGRVSRFAAAIRRALVDD